MKAGYFRLRRVSQQKSSVRSICNRHFKYWSEFSKIGFKRRGQSFFSGSGESIPTFKGI